MASEKEGKEIGRSGGIGKEKKKEENVKMNSLHSKFLRTLLISHTVSTLLLLLYYTTSHTSSFVLRSAMILSAYILFPSAHLKCM